MLSQEDSGNRNNNNIIQIARIIAANPWLKLNSLVEINRRQGRSVVEREVFKLIESVNPNRLFTLVEVINLLAGILSEPSSTNHRLLIAPADLIDSIPEGNQIRAIPIYLEEILRKAQREIILLTPFWDMPTIIDLLRCAPRETIKTELVLLLVHMGRPLTHIESMVHEIQQVWPFNRIRLYFHIASKEHSSDYPHAKCLVVDREHGYLGSANFTSAGMKGHFELGVSLDQEDSKKLGSLLQHLWSQNNLFRLAWDSAIG